LGIGQIEPRIVADREAFTKADAGGGWNVCSLAPVDPEREEKDEGGRMKDEKGDAWDFLFTLHPSAFILERIASLVAKPIMPPHA